MPWTLPGFTAAVAKRLALRLKNQLAQDPDPIAVPLHRLQEAMAKALGYPH